MSAFSSSFVAAVFIASYFLSSLAYHINRLINTYGQNYYNTNQTLSHHLIMGIFLASRSINVFVFSIMNKKFHRAFRVRIIWCGQMIHNIPNCTHNSIFSQNQTNLLKHHNMNLAKFLADKIFCTTQYKASEKVLGHMVCSGKFHFKKLTLDILYHRQT